MNILPKKSWHVRTRKNIEKVRNDEKEASIRETDRLERIAIAEREARTAFLRQRTQSTAEPSCSTSSSAAGVREVDQKERFDIFSGVEQGKGDIRRNRDREKEDKERTEEWEQKVGILTYLHKKDDDSGQLWYLKPPDQRLGTKSELEEERLRQTVKRHDPLVLMTKYTDQIKSAQTKEKGDKIRRHHQRHHQKRHTEETDGPKSVGRLREERLKREEKERRRSEKLLKGNATPQVSSRGRDERNLRFNSQFNPQLARH